MFRLDPLAVAVSLGIAFAASMLYFGLLALMARGLRLLDSKQAVTFLAMSFPFRLGLLGMALVWLLRQYGLVGALAVLPSMWLSHYLIHRWVTKLDRSA